MIPGSSLNGSLQRRAKLRELIRNHGFVSIPDLREAMSVSESTIRRDLEALEEQGEAKRTHGGVFSTGPTSSVKQFDSKLQQGNWELKRSIAIEAAKLIKDYDTVLLDGGSTTYELARQLVGRPLQIVTNSLPVANLFSSSETAELVLLGGALHSRTGLTLGFYSNQMLASLNVQKAFLSVAGVTSKGFFNSNMLIVETERAMIACADCTIIVADSSKFGRSSLVQVCDWNQVHTIVADDALSVDWREKVLAANVDLVVASLPNAATDRIACEVKSPTSSEALAIRNEVLS